MKKNLPSHRFRGFTLVELLVVIVIVATLASLAFMFARKGLAKASEARALSRLRESGAILLADAQEKNGKMQYTLNPEPKSSPYLPYNIVRAAIGMKIPTTGIQTEAELCEIMHWDAKKVKPTLYQRNCFGINMTNIPDIPEGFGVTWDDESLDTDSGPVQVRTLITTTLKRPEFYPILMDSSTKQGEEIFRIREQESCYVGLRNSGKAHAYFLDGSAREMGPPELKKAGFTQACDNSKTPPQMKSF